MALDDVRSPFELRWLNETIADRLLTIDGCRLGAMVTISERLEPDELRGSAIKGDETSVARTLSNYFCATTARYGCSSPLSARGQSSESYTVGLRRSAWTRVWHEGHTTTGSNQRNAA
jgi:hypothetical protein